MEIKNLLALAKEVALGTHQAIAEFNDILEENDIERILQTNVYYADVPHIDFMDQEDINSISIVMTNFASPAEAKGFVSGIESIRLAFNDRYCASFNLNSLCFGIYVEILARQFGVVYTNQNKFSLPLDTIFDQQELEIIRLLNRWLLNHVDSSFVKRTSVRRVPFYKLNS